MRHAVCGFLIVLQGWGCVAAVSEKSQVRARLHYDLGVEALGRDDLRTALQELRLADNDNPYDANTQQALGLNYQAMDQFADSERHYLRALGLKKDFAEAYNNYGTLLLEMGRISEAVPNFQKALDNLLYRTPSLAEGNLGWAYFKLGDLELARRHLRRAVITNPQFCRGYVWLAEVELLRKDPDQVSMNAAKFMKHCAENEAVRAVVGDEHVRQIRFIMGQSYALLGKTEKAREEFEACAKTSQIEPMGIAKQCAERLVALNDGHAG